jgi:hypothetical protein
MRILISAVLFKWAEEYAQVRTCERAIHCGPLASTALAIIDPAVRKIRISPRDLRAIFGET